MTNIKKGHVDENLFRCVYTNNYNILRIHSVILALLEEELKNLSKLENELNIYKEKLKKPLFYNDKKKVKKKIRELCDNIEEIKNKRRMDEYMELSSPLIQKYKNSSSIKKRVFGEEVDESDESIDYDKIKIIEDYLILAKRYVPIDIMRVQKNIVKCFVCGYNLSNIRGYQIEICPSCSTEISAGYSFSVGEAVNTKDSRDLVNFKKVLKRYQGKQPDVIPENLYKDLDHYFESRGLLIGEEVRKLPLNSRGKRGDTNHQMLYEALAHTKHTDHYEDANLIGNKYWGWQLKNIPPHIEKMIINDYKKTQAVYTSDTEKERSSSLGTQYRLFKHLELRGIDCHIDEFKIADNEESIRFHETTWEKMCRGSNDPDIYYIETKY